MVKGTIVDYLISGITNNKPITIETNNKIEYFSRSKQRE